MELPPRPLLVVALLVLAVGLLGAAVTDDGSDGTVASVDAGDESTTATTVGTSTSSPSSVASTAATFAPTIPQIVAASTVTTAARASTTTTTAGTTTTEAATTTTTTPVAAGFARLTIRNDYDRAVHIAITYVQRYDIELPPGGVTDPFDMPVTDEHAGGADTTPVDEQCGTGDDDQSFVSGHVYDITVRAWDGTGQSSMALDACADGTRPAMRTRDLTCGTEYWTPEIRPPTC